MADDISYPPSGHKILGELEETSFWFNHRNDVLIAAVRHFPPFGRILDVGGGNGYVSKALINAGFEATVVEPGPDGARTARERGLEVIESPFQDVNVEPGSVSGIGAFDVIEHINDDTKLLLDFYRALPSGGRLYLTVPAYPWLWSKDDIDAGHFRRYSVSQLKARVGEAGFVVRFATYFFACLVLPVVALRTLPSALGIRQESTPQSMAADHAPRGGVAGLVLNWCLSVERRVIVKGRRIPFGTSVLMIAEKL